MEKLNATHIIQAYQAGASAQQLGNECGVKGDTILRLLRQHGVQTRTMSEAAKVWHRGEGRGMLCSKAVVFAYQAGDSINALAKAHGVDRGTITRTLRAAGVQGRTASEQERLKWATMPPGARAQQVAAAHASIRGRHEANVQFALAAVGLRFAPQQVGGYHLDLAHHELLIAIEIETGYGFIENASRVERLKHLLDSGWCVLYIMFAYGTPCLRSVTQKCTALVELASRDESVFGQYGVLRGNGERRPTRSRYLAGLPRIPGF